VKCPAVYLIINPSCQTILSFRKHWEKLDAPTDYKWMIIRDVLQAKNSSERRMLIRQWTISVWNSWKMYHDYIGNLADKYILLL
jgi:hypothetical protein